MGYAWRAFFIANPRNILVTTIQLLSLVILLHPMISGRPSKKDEAVARLEQCSRMGGRYQLQRLKEFPAAIMEEESGIRLVLGID
jgi:hypothetical protein